jgi:Family of unknown function (DUF6252)
MKTTKTFRYVIVFFLVASFGCSKDSIDDDKKFNYGTMQAIIGGSFMALPPVMPVREVYNSDNISVYGYKDEVGITLMFPDSIGTYQFSSNEASATLTYGDPLDFFDVNNDGPVIDYRAIEGSITLTEINDERCRGTFHFTGEKYGGEVMAVSNGEFNVTRE